VTDSKREAHVAKAVQTMVAECEGSDFDVRTKFAVLLPTLRGHKVLFANMTEQPWGIQGQCEVCGQVVKVRRGGTNVEGRAVENDCPAAEWKRP